MIKALITTPKRENSPLSKETRTLSKAVRTDLSLAGALRQSTGKPVKWKGRSRNPEMERRGRIRPGRESTTGQNHEAKKTLSLSGAGQERQAHRDLLELVDTEIWLVSF